MTTMMNPPKATQIPYEQKLHGDVRQDPYYWLKDKTNPEVLAYLEAENRYFNDVLAPLKPLTDQLFNEMVERVPASETEVPVQNGPYFYYSREEKELQYPVYARKKATSRAQLDKAEEEITLDLNKLATGDDYLSVTEKRYSTDHQFLAYLENRDGTDIYTAFIKNLETNEIVDQIPNVYIYGSIEWSKCGQYIFYTTVDPMQRPYRLWRHEIGTDSANDVLLYEETDVTFTLFISKSQSGQFIFVTSHSTMTTEVRLIDADAPLQELQLFAPRQRGILYDIEHWHDELFILTNENALNFTLQRCPLDNFSARANVFPYDEKRYLQSIYPFKEKLLIGGRENGLHQIWLLENNELVPLTWDEPIYSLDVIGEQSFDADEVLINYVSLLTPQTTFGIRLATGERTSIQVAPITGPFERELYEQKQLWATARDGVKIPLNIVYKKDALQNGPAPLILTSYGSYGYSSDPYFSPYRLPFLDRGVILVTAQVRGGSEMGRGWYEDGKLQKKRNSFTDFIDAAEFLFDQGYTTPELIAARGGSAGGLLVGAVANMAGERFKVIVPEVPFVDIVTTMLDDTLPLTTLEWDEWGNPQNVESYFYMKSYSPYDNVEAKNYPHMFITTGLNDPRVGYFEPAKWVARLRELKTDSNTLVMKTNMGAGHFGASGRFNQLRENAEMYAFVLDKLGIT